MLYTSHTSETIWFLILLNGFSHIHWFFTVKTDWSLAKKISQIIKNCQPSIGSWNYFPVSGPSVISIYVVKFPSFPKTFGWQRGKENHELEPILKQCVFDSWHPLNREIILVHWLLTLVVYKVYDIMQYTNSNIEIDLYLIGIFKNIAAGPNYMVAKRRYRFWVLPPVPFRSQKCENW